MTLPEQPHKTSNDSTAVSSAHGFGRGWFAMFAIFAVLYALTASRGIQWQDAGFHIVRMMKGELVHPLGLALSHPFHYWLGRGFLSLSVLEPASAVTLVSALAGALTVANVYGCVVALTGRPFAGVVAGISLGIANTFWQMATLAETYTLTTALLSGEIWATVCFLRSSRRRFLYAAVVCDGLGVANHMQAALTSPVLLIVMIVAFRRRVVSGRALLGAVALWLVASAPYTGLVLLTMFQSGDWMGTLHSALFGNVYADNVLNFTPSWRQAAVVAGFVLLNFPNMTLPLSIRGGLGMGREESLRPVRRYVFSILVIHVLFVLRYDVVDQHTFFLPTYLIVAILAGVGFSRLWHKGNDAPRASIAVVCLLLAATPIVYAFVPTLARRAGVLRYIAHEKPYRDDYVYLFSPWTVLDRSAERVGREAIELADDNGLVILEDSMARPAVEYEKMQRGRHQVDVQSKPQDGPLDPDLVVRAISQGRAVVLVPLDRNKPFIPTPLGTWSRVGDLYVLESR